MTIWTFNARDTVFFDVVMQHEGIGFAALGPEIRSIHARTVELLAGAGVAYEALRPALVPQRSVSEVVLVFDSTKIESGAYGLDMAKVLLPLLDRKWTGSILEGDLIHHDQVWAGEMLIDGLTAARNCEIGHTQMLFAVYLTNLSTARLERILVGLRDYIPFIGHADVSYRSNLKTWLSVTLSSTYLKHRDVFLTRHPDDLEQVSDENPGWWPIEEHKYRTISLPGTLSFDPFLSYKIERDVVGELESDTIHGLSMISSDPRSLDSFSVLVEEAKLAHLKRDKAASFAGAGLEDVTAEELALQIRAKINENYIYELDFLAEHGVSKFNIILEFSNGPSGRPFKVLAGLEYRPADERLRLITFF